MHVFTQQILDNLSNEDFLTLLQDSTEVCISPDNAGMSEFQAQFLALVGRHFQCEDDNKDVFYCERNDIDMIETKNDFFITEDENGTMFLSNGVSDNTLIHPLPNYEVSISASVESSQIFSGLSDLHNVANIKGINLLHGGTSIEVDTISWSSILDFARGEKTSKLTQTPEQCAFLVQIASMLHRAASEKIPTLYVYNN